MATDIRPASAPAFGPVRSRGAWPATAASSARRYVTRVGRRSPSASVSGSSSSAVSAAIAPSSQRPRRARRSGRRRRGAADPGGPGRQAGQRRDAGRLPPVQVRDVLPARGQPLVDPRALRHAGRRSAPRQPRIRRGRSDHQAADRAREAVRPHVADRDRDRPSIFVSIVDRRRGLRDAAGRCDRRGRRRRLRDLARPPGAGRRRPGVRDRPVPWPWAGGRHRRRGHVRRASSSTATRARSRPRPTRQPDLVRLDHDHLPLAGPVRLAAARSSSRSS